MARPSKRIRAVGRQQLDRRLEEVRRITPILQRPANGWVSALRSALGMSQEDLAKRIGVSRQAVSQLEQRELDGSITLNALRQAAEALGGQLAYILVPDRPIAKTLGERAYRIARQMVTSVRHSMRLEDQETDSDLEQRARELAKELLASPHRLWSHPDAP